MSLTLRIERTLDNRHEGEHVRWLEAQNEALRERIAVLEQKLGERPALPQGFNLVRAVEQAVP